MRTINISDLNSGLPTITSSSGQYMVEAAVFCLLKNSHISGDCILNCITKVRKGKQDEYKDENFQLIWDKLDSRAETTYGDLQVATEYGAMALAVLLTIKLTNFTTVERSMKGTGIDYWIGDKDGYMFQKKARLEISGIFKGDESQFKSRIKQKFKQTNISDNCGLCCFVSVVEFGKPRASFLSKEASYE
ncbi:MAG: hypothetical protein LBD37_09280 [Treponema sp.]|jgi:hypothetical protein|nr:hypothetical protein [Treponema sp.]